MYQLTFIVGASLYTVNAPSIEAIAHLWRMLPKNCCPRIWNRQFKGKALLVL